MSDINEKSNGHLKLTSITTSRDKDVQQIIDWAIAQHFETLIAIGMKDGLMQIHHSETVNVFELIGAIEVCKADLVAESQNDTE